MVRHRNRIQSILRESPSIGETESLCPVCLRLLEAFRIAKNGNVYLAKECPEHGIFQAVVWRRDAEHYLSWGYMSEPAVGPLTSVTEIERGCPFDCGPCPEHRANACTMVMEVTHACNLLCPVCFADAKESDVYEPEMNDLRKMYERIQEVTGNPAIQLSGGEPTLRNDLPKIISMGRAMGFEHIMVNTNGVRIGKDREYLARLVDSGAGTIYLQFDGVSDDVYRSTRGTHLFQIKNEAIRNCASEGVGVILVVTLVPGVNLYQMGDIVEFAKRWIPAVRGIHFQPIGYFGRYPSTPRDEDRITIPDVISGLVEQTHSELKEENFLPRRSQDAHCAFSSLFLYEEGQLKPITRSIPEIVVGGWGGFRHAPWESARSFMSIHWRLSDKEKRNKNLCSCSNSCSMGPDNGKSSVSWDEISARIQESGISITCMPFQDVWTVDLERLKRCCGHVVTPELMIVPFCAFYLTNVAGERLYPDPYARRKTTL
jgi:uncharacterized radical SAM superfamily Fe-S cluster-containing enzyme